MSGGAISNQLSIDYNSTYPLVLNGSENYSVINFRARGTNVVDVGWFNESRGNVAYIANRSNSGVISVNHDGVYYSDGLNNFKKYTIIHSGNYNSYAPTLTGTGASGTWGISISGNAATATKLQTPRTIWGQSFDGNGNVNGVLSITTTDEPIYGIGPEINFYLGGRGQLAMIRAVYESVDWSSINPAAGSLRFYTAENNSPTEKMRICPNGNVLIGTATDNGYKLQVNGSERVYGDLIVDGEVSALVA